MVNIQIKTIVTTDESRLKKKICLDLQLALTHTSYKVKYGTNTDHARNSLSNCGMRQLEYGDRKIHFQHTRKRGNYRHILFLLKFPQ